MKRMKGFITGIEVTLVVMVLAYVGIVGSHALKGEKAPESQPVTNYNK